MFEHFTVMKKEAVEGLDIKPDGIYVDCTLGGGGHSSSILSRLNENGKLYAFDQDDDALQAASERLKKCGSNVELIKSNFRNITNELHQRGVNKVDGILFDLGVSSPQLDEGERGFSYHQDASLDMRMDQTSDLTAYHIVNEWPYEKLVSIFFKYGEEKFSKQIARKIEAVREEHAIETTLELVEIIKDAIPAAARRTGGHPAKRIFQAIRIAVNDELTAFEEAIEQAGKLLKPGGRIAVITFHSLEDRICKQTFKQWSKPPSVPRNLPIIPEDQQPDFRLITRKPILPSEEELEQNRRSRSAKLRIIEKIKDKEGDRDE